ncbi:hypothetical protein I4U23_003827 [Adineta vaga]|nr:hypothetical protein I4U23_003827 [Adineta vaga]
MLSSSNTFDTFNNSENASKDSDNYEEKKIYEGLTPQILMLAAEMDHILHHRIADMSLEEICSDETKQIVANMIYSIRPQQLESANAPYNKAAGMAANQWNINKRIFLFCPDGSDGDIKVIFNPTYKSIDPPQNATDDSNTKTSDQFTNFFREGCFSVWHAYGIVERYTHIEISYFDCKGIQHTNEKLSGWQARVWQHETDHLDGILYSNRQSGINYGPNCTEFRRFPSKTEFEEHLQKK